MVEARLAVSLPRELKRIYMAIHNQNEYFAGAEHFLSLDEIYTEQGMIVFFRKKRTPVAGYDMESGCLARYYIAVMYSDEKLLAWIRSNGLYGDIHIGAVDEVHIEAFGEHFVEIETPIK